MPKLPQIRSLLEKFAPGGKGERLILNTVHIRNRVLASNGKSVTTAVAGETYGHSIDLIRNYALWPVTVRVESSLPDTDQLSFQSAPDKWGFTSELLPNHGWGPATEVLYCRERRSGSAEINSKITCNSGHSDTMTLGLKIE